MLVDQTHLALSTEEETEVTETENEENIFTLIQEYLNLKSIDETPCVTFYKPPGVMVETSSEIDVSFGFPLNEQLMAMPLTPRQPTAFPNVSQRPWWPYKLPIPACLIPLICLENNHSLYITNFY